MRRSFVYIFVSPTNELSVDEVPFEDIHVEDVQVERVSLHTVQLTIRTYLGLSLIEVRLCSCLAVELLNIIRSRVEQVAVIRLLVGCGESTKNQYVFI